MNRSSVKPGRLAFNALVSIFAYKIVNVLKLNACGVPLISLLVVKVLFATTSAKPTIRFEYLFNLINKHTFFKSPLYEDSSRNIFRFPCRAAGSAHGREAGGRRGRGGGGGQAGGRQARPAPGYTIPATPICIVSWVRIGSVVGELGLLT